MGKKLLYCDYISSDGTKCDHTSKRSDNLARHKRDKHLGYVYHCGNSDCFYWASNVNHVLQHKKSEHTVYHGQANVEAIQQCRGCKYYFKDNAHCDAHTQTCEVFKSLRKDLYQKNLFNFICFAGNKKTIAI